MKSIFSSIVTPTTNRELGNREIVNRILNILGRTNKINGLKKAFINYFAESKPRHTGF